MITRLLLGLLALALLALPARAQILDKQKLLDRETFWDNRDWDWYKANIPFFECPDADIQTTYYYRWELLTKHLTYGSPNTGYVFTEFIDRPFWSGTYGAISCPAGHQLYEARWLRDPRYVRDYSRYWFRTPGAQPRRYSTWLADAIWAAHLVHPDTGFAKDLLPDLIKNYQGWEKDHFVPDVGLFWQTGHDDGMEININSRQTKDTVRGAPGYRPTLNSYMFADAMAIAHFAELADDMKTAGEFSAKAAVLKKNLQAKLWDPKREFFFPMYKQDEERDGFKIKAGGLTYQTGKFAGSPHGREEIGFVPWQFILPNRSKYNVAWKYLMDKNYFFADFGPTTVERQDPQFEIAKRCCEWSGNSWPYATTQTLKAMANLLQNSNQTVITRADYLKLLRVYAKTHRKNGKPYLAEACHPDTGSWEGNDSYNHSEHYFHSGFNDLVITGLVGFMPRGDEKIEVQPLAPDSWDYFALDGVQYHGQTLSVIWDRTGKRYGRGAGLHVFADGKQLATSPKLEYLEAKLPFKPTGFTSDLNRVEGRQANFAVNNDGNYYPRIRASYTAPGMSPSKLIDGNYWYHRDPPNRWTCAGSPNASDWVDIDFGVERAIREFRLYYLDDGEGIVPPASVVIEFLEGGKWVSIPVQLPPVGRRANVLRCDVRTSKVRATFSHAAGGRTGLTELEAWGPADGEVKPAPMPAGNLAQGAKASASFTSRFDKVAMANDGVVNFNPGPANRWTSYESPNASDWLEIDFGAEKEVGRVELAIYDDRGGVRAPAKYAVQWWDGKEWRDVAKAKHSPAKPVGGQWNEATFDSVKTSKVRVVFTHEGKARSGVSEILIWRE